MRETSHFRAKLVALKYIKLSVPANIVIWGRCYLCESESLFHFFIYIFFHIPYFFDF